MPGPPWLLSDGGAKLRLCLQTTSGIRRLGRFEKKFCSAERAGGDRHILGVHAFVPGTDFDKLAPRQLMDGFQRPILGELYDEDIFE